MPHSLLFFKCFVCLLFVFVLFGLFHLFFLRLSVGKSFEKYLCDTVTSVCMSVRARVCVCMHVCYSVCVCTCLQRTGVEMCTFILSVYS